jgi:hypothetical protein
VSARTAYGPSTGCKAEGAGRHGDPAERVLRCAGANRQDRNPERRREVPRAEDERLERRTDGCDSLDLDEPPRRLDLYLEPDLRRQELDHRLDLFPRFHLRHDDDIDVRRGGDVVAPPGRAHAVDPDGDRAACPQLREVVAGGLLVGDGDAVLQIYDDLVSRQIGSLGEHLRARRRDDEARAAEPGRHRPTLTLSLHARHGPLISRLYSRLMDTSGSGLRLIVALVGALTVLLLVLPVHS